MDTKVAFSAAETDLLTGIPIYDLSAVIHTLIPIRLIKWKTVKRHYESALSDLKQKSTDDIGQRLDIIVTGSTAEGYGLPLATMRTFPSNMQLLFDVDVLLVSKDIPVSTVKIEEQDDNAKAFLEFENIHPGYVRVCLPRIIHHDNAFVYNEESGKYYLSGTTYIENILSYQGVWNQEDNLETTVQGPALSRTDPRMITTENIKIPGIGISTDIVCALPCSPWPEVARNIYERASQSEWPRLGIIESIMNEGCHVVAVPSRNSANPDIEWRLSFSASEGRLAREAVTDHQRQCYIFLKILRYQSLKPKTVLSSYVFKSVFLHCCEHLPVNHWQQYPGNCLLYMLDVLLECLHKKNVPTYFLTENNLIDHLSEEELTAAIDALNELRTDPMTPILEFMDDKMFSCHCAMLPYRKVISPLLQHIQEYKENKNLASPIYQGVILTYQKICMSLLMENISDDEIRLIKSQESVRYAIDLFTNWINPSVHYRSLVGFINSLALEFPVAGLSARFLEGATSLLSEYPEFDMLRGNLACMYHAMAYTHPEESTPRTEYLNKAGDLFEEVYSVNKGSSIDYVAYLMKQKKIGRAEEILVDILEDGTKLNNQSFVYGAKEMYALEDPIKKLVQDQGKVEFDIISLAYVYMVKCLCTKEPSDIKMSEVTSLIDKFQNHCDVINNDNLFLLLQLTKDIVAEFTKENIPQNDKEVKYL